MAAGATAAPYTDPARPSSSGPAAGGYVPYADIYASQPEHPYSSKFQSDAAHREVNTSSSRAQKNGRAYQQAQYQPANPYANSAYSADERSTSESPRPRHSGEGRRRHRKHRDHSRSRQKSKTRNGSQTRARSSIRDRFDTSEKGVGYSTLAALAGGLVGSEVGKGILPTAVGAVLGGLGANAYQGREKYVLRICCSLQFIS